MAYPLLIRPILPLGDHVTALGPGARLLCLWVAECLGIPQTCYCFRDESLLSGDEAEHNNKGSTSEYRKSVEEKAEEYVACIRPINNQYANRHPVHLHDFFNAWVRLRGKVSSENTSLPATCHSCPSGGTPLVTISVNKASVHTLLLRRATTHTDGRSGI
ncbi:hypothetical protein EYF80_026655 [Liparis tanakae]|uniref:Uncharacterized protein n=1 Tax=Liparis tanakae TaxID=230148 RepID=A0A4Z2HC36_9TELE|nr:hypothetical protein EYF80_026655 [Liparis tanakae]